MAIDQIVKSGTVHEIVPEIAPLFSTSAAYSVGDCVIKDAVLYRFKTAHSAGAWSASEVEAITVGKELTDLKGSLTENVADLKADLTNPLNGKEFVIPRSMIWGRQIRTANDYNAFTNNDTRSVSVDIVFKDSVRLKATDNLEALVYNLDANTNTGWVTETLIPANTAVSIAYRFTNGNTFTADGVEKVKLYTSVWGYECFINDYFTKLDSSGRIISWNENAVPYYNPCYNGSYWVSDNMDGCRTRHTYTNYRAAKAPIFSDKGVYIVVGYASDMSCTIFYADYTHEVLAPGTIKFVDANTAFTIFFTSETNAKYCVFVTVDESVKGIGFTQRILPLDLRRADTSFRTALNTLYLIDRERDAYSVIKDGVTIKTRESLDHTVGHANTCNYLNGKVYISDWTDGTLIHVFTVDDEENTMSYAYDITVPYESAYGVDYYVCDSLEKQIISLGHKYTYNKDTNESNNLLVFCVWNKVGATYEKAREFDVPSPAILQGMTYVKENNSIYYVANNASYETTRVVKIPIDTGLTENGTNATGTLASSEGEAIMYIGSETFVVTDVDGSQYLYKF